METQFVCQKIMAKKVILQQCAQPQVIYLSLAMFLWTMFQHVQTFHTAESIIHLYTATYATQFRINSTVWVFFHEQSPGQWKQHLLAYFQFNLTKSTLITWKVKNNH